MPKLFDLLPDDKKKALAEEAREAAERADNGRGNGGKAGAGGDRQHKKAHAAGNDDRPRGNDDRRHGNDDRPRGKNLTPGDNTPVPHDRKFIPRDRPTQNAPLTAPDFVAVDVETTGLDFKNDRVIEVGAIRFINGKPEEEFSTFVNAGVPIPDFITRLTKIGDDDIRAAPKFTDMAMRLLEFIGDLPLCGHQIEFDLTFINEELKRAGFPTVTPQLIDTALLSRVLLQHAGRFSLKHVCGTLGVTLDNAHRALHDAKASGEVAVRVIPKLGELPLDIRRALAAFAPGSMFKTLAIRSLGGVRYGVDLTCGTPLPEETPNIDRPEWYLAVDANEVEEIFSSDGKAGKAIKGFTPRPAQIEMARHVIGALNDNGILVAEAGTGTGKSLAYLVPAALHALKNNCRAVVSTHTRNLQDQLINNDLPAVAAICGGGLRFSKLKGRGNYLCRSRFYTLLRGEAGNLSPRERNAVLPLVVWSQRTQTGDVEEQTFFNPKWFYKTWNMVSADSQDCSGRRCRYYSTCFLHKARRLAQTSHIVVINHALFYSDICSETSFLGDIGSIVFDEAHHLESSGHRHLRTEFDTNRANAFIDKLQNLLHTVSGAKGAIGVNVGEFENELKKHIKHIRKRAPDMLAELDRWARDVSPDSEADYQIPVDGDSLGRLPEPAVLDITLGELQDSFHHFRQLLWAADRDKTDGLREETQACAEQVSQLRADIQYLTAAKTEDHVFWLEGNHAKNWTKLCGVPLDISELLTQIWERCNGGIVFTSATLATGGGTRENGRPTGTSMDYFKRSAGLEPFAGKTASIILPGPCDANRMLFGAFRNCPDPDDPAFPEFAADVIAGIHSRLGKNILVLFTSNAMLNDVYNQLKDRPEVDRNNLLSQASGGNRHSMLEQFKTQSGMILLGTDSFWEGVDAPGEACEAVIVARLPFPVPTHPLTRALGRRMEELHGNSFFSYSVPEAVIKFRQGAGRLIRSADDRGVFVVLDNRIVTKGYGKQFANALGAPVNEFADVNAMIEKTRVFFESAPGPDIKYVPLEDS